MGDQANGVTVERDADVDLAKAHADMVKTIDRFFEAQMRPLRLLALCGDLLAGRITIAQFDEKVASLSAEAP